MKETFAQSPHLSPLPEGEEDASGVIPARSRIARRIVDIVVAGIFILAGLTKLVVIDHLLLDLAHFRLADLVPDIRQITLANPVGFARDIDNYKILPWPAAVALGFYLSWLEIFCGIALIVRRLYQGSLVILTGSTVLFIVASIIAKARGLDISCGCFGHASKGWSFGWHLALDFGILAALVILMLGQNKKISPANHSNRRK